MMSISEVGRKLAKELINWKFREKRVSYGELNPDKTYYVIRTRRDKVGLMSYYHNVLIQTKYALEQGYIPVVDMKNYKNTYLDINKLNKENSWEYYFKQPFDSELDEVYKSKNVILSSGEMPITTAPRHMYYEIYKNKRIAKEYYSIINKNIRFSDVFMKEFEKAYKDIFPKNERVLGVVSRETDMINFPNHSKLPTREYLLKETQRLMKEYKCNYVFIASDKDSTIEYFKENLEGNVLFNEAKRFDEYIKKGRKVLSDMHFERENDCYLKGKEYLITIALLSKCDCIFGSLVGATLGAIGMNQGKYENIDIFDEGIY